MHSFMVIKHYFVSFLKCLAAVSFIQMVRMLCTKNVLNIDSMSSHLEPSAPMFSLVWSSVTTRLVGGNVYFKPAFRPCRRLRRLENGSSLCFNMYTTRTNASFSVIFDAKPRTEGKNPKCAK